MPLWRYFAFAGSALLALLLLADWYLPQSSPVGQTRAGVDKTVIRIQSSRQWPEAIVFDTNRPTISPPLMTAEAAPVEAAPVETPLTVERSPREAFAQLSPTASIHPAASPVVLKKTAPRRLAKARAPVRRVASYQPMESRSFFPFGW